MVRGTFGITISDEFLQSLCQQQRFQPLSDPVPTGMAQNPGKIVKRINIIGLNVDRLLQFSNRLDRFHLFDRESLRDCCEPLPGLRDSFNARSYCLTAFSALPCSR